MNDNRPVPSTDDGADRTLRCQSWDGYSWDRLEDFGDYGMHYVRILRLIDGRLLMTFTQRSLFYPIGLHAVLSLDDGETWNLKQDHIIIDGLTPWGAPSGGGFGNTIQLPNEDLVSCYSYGAGDKTMIEAVRWRLPPIS